MTQLEQIASDVHEIKAALVGSVDPPQTGLIARVERLEQTAVVSHRKSENLFNAFLGVIAALAVGVVTAIASLFQGGKH